ncbi:uncharacterized protein LACBIDRAFT_321280 [Laccaria bicolor S238N-H82]|uniref:Predicted protein n=1 Tax=Laccaria bicolor (strain S238N-H82 / ATCC MYA-4686) TaxID=486041 RepID=B0CPC8_LACBS|nr:uncharacterized protein LACBIDRAFT_321280 [Laccaria bicolor S238N-H82]EDR15451.1 predicted protein [Laccaria bicolor S238N-H82]|eukprot:XP_001873659.1 predicted protein [Laccaria bicolor S238N-H82]
MRRRPQGADEQETNNGLVDNVESHQLQFDVMSSLSVSEFCDWLTLVLSSGKNCLRDSLVHACPMRHWTRRPKTSRWSLSSMKCFVGLRDGGILLAMANLGSMLSGWMPLLDVGQMPSSETTTQGSAGLCKAKDRSLFYSSKIGNEVSKRRSYSRCSKSGS